MDEITAIKLFESQEIRTKWNEDEEEWCFSIVDVIAVLTENEFQIARNYWKVLKHRLKEEGSEVVTKCNQLKLKAPDGKLRLTDVANTGQLFRLIQSIPSKKAEPFKLWLARIGKERVDEIEDPEITINRALDTYSKKGYSNQWINQRLKSIEIRKELTDEWQRCGVDKPTDFAILTNEISKTWADKTVKEYKQFKNLKKENLRDNMTNVELVLNMLAEVSTKEISKKEYPENMDENKSVARKGGGVAKVARENLEKQIGEKVITSKNAKEIHFSKKKEIK